MEAKVELFQSYERSVFETMKSEKGKAPKKVRTGSVPVVLSLLVNEFSVKEAHKVNAEKLAQTMAKAMARRFEAKQQGIDTGFKVSKEAFIRVSLDDKCVFDLEAIKLSSSVESKLKLRPKPFEADKAAELKRLQDIVLYTINDAKISATELKAVFE
jgi:hypothetical protein